MVSCGANPPPATNRGVEHTNSYSSRLDYLSYMLPLSIPLEYAVPGYASIDWQEMPHGGYGYKSLKRAGHVSIYYEGRPEMGTYVQISGQGIDELGPYISDDWRGCLRYLVDLGVKVRRVDWALDDRSGAVTVDEVIAKLERDEYTSIWKDWDPYGGGKKAGKRTGKTVYVGSRRSDMYLCVYDKASERASKQQGRLLDGGVGRVKLGSSAAASSSEPWVRWELRAKGERAHALAILIAGCEDGEAVGGKVAGVLRRYLDFKESSQSDTNKGRWQTALWWDALLSGAEKLRLVVESVTRTLESVRCWLDYQAGPSIAMLMRAQGGALDWLMDIARDGDRRLRPRHWAMLAAC